MSIDQLTGGNIEPRGLEEEMRSSYLDYAMSVIVGRALPDVRDGLKPVHRRVLYAMYESGLQPNRPHRKCANVVGGVMGNYHPHGDSAIYDTLVRLGQDFAMRYPLVAPAGQLRLDRQRLAGGNALHRGAPVAARDGDAARHRRGHRRLRAELRRVAPGAARPSVALPEPARQRRLRDRRRHGDQHPAAQPARVDRRGGGLHRRPGDRRQGADAPSEGAGLPDRGHDRRARRESATPTRPAAAAWSCAGKAHVENPLERGKEAIIVTEMPYQVYKGDGRGDGSGLIKKIAEQVQNGRIKEIADLRDESDKSGIRLVIELKRDAIPKVVLNKLYKHTQLQTTFGVNMVALVDGVPRTLGLLPIVRNYVDHQREVVVRRTKHELREREARLHILEGLLVAISDIDAVIELIRGSSDPDAGARRPDRALRAVPHPGAGDPRHAARPAHRARGRQGQAGARRDGRAHQGAARDPRRRGQGHGDHQGGAPRDPRGVRRRAPHRDHALRGRDRHRGPDRRPADGHRDHALGLHQDAAARDLPPAEARRRRRDRAWT